MQRENIWWRLNTEHPARFMKKNLSPYDLPAVHKALRSQEETPVLRKKVKPYDLTSIPKLGKKDLDIMRKQW